MTRQATVEKVKKKQVKAEARVQKRLHLRQLAKKTNVLSKCQAFASLSEKSSHRIIDAMAYKKLPLGTHLCKQGEGAQFMYVLMSGLCNVTINHRKVGTLSELDVFGESALFGQRAKRTATVTIASECVEVLVLSRKHIVGLMNSGDLDQKSIERISKISKGRSNKNLKKRLLQSIKVMKQMNAGVEGEVVAGGSGARSGGR